MAVGGGLSYRTDFAVMQYCARQDRCARYRRCQYAAGVVVAIGMALVAISQLSGLHVPAIILVVSAINVGVAWFMLKNLPMDAFRDLTSIILDAFMRVEVKGRCYPSPESR